ncbi:amidohydrolase family protein [Chloroflexota bacterium]
MKIDVFPHIGTSRYKDALLSKVPRESMWYKHLDGIQALVDIDARIKIMDKYEGLAQVLTMTGPPVEEVCGPEYATELARIANDELAGLVSKYPDKFIAAAACLPMNDMDATLKELDRAITELGFKGAQIYTNINGKPLDSPEFMPLYEKMESYDLPIWIHPHRNKNVADYPTESESQYHIQAAFGWPYESTAAMTRLIFSGVLDKYPRIKIIIHHAGAMIPFLANKTELVYDLLQTQPGYTFISKLPKAPLDYYRMFYVDTSVSGNTSALMCAHAFYGADHMLFGTDMPYDRGNGDIKVRETIRSIEEMAISESDKQKIFEGNAKKLLHL